MHSFLIHLYGPMQSWGDTGFGQLREAGEFPSAAGVLGIIAAAMGLPRADARLLDLHQTLKIHVATVRRGSVLRDFHTVETRQGGPRTLTSRDYHHDAHFVALVEGGREAVQEAETALRDPVFGTFLGRRSCPPALPLLPEPISGDRFASLRDAAIASAYAFPRGDKTWRRGHFDDTLTAWLSGHLTIDRIPDAFTGAAISHGTRRSHLIGTRRAYSSEPFTRLRLVHYQPDSPAAEHEAYFDAAP